MSAIPGVIPNKPLALAKRDFSVHKFQVYEYLRQYAPVKRAKIFNVNMFVTARYEDCLHVVKSEQFLRDRSTIMGGRKTPFPLPKNLAFLADSMIVMDDPEHRRLRALVQKAFAPKTLKTIEHSVEQYAHDLLDQCLAQDVCNFQADYALPIPERVIAEIVGVDPVRMPEFRQGMKVLSSGFNGLSILRTLLWDLRKTVNLVKELIAYKREHPGEDVLTALIDAEEDGERLSESELISMVFLLIVAGFETTVHLITNGTLALIQHPDQQQKLRDDQALMGSAVEEMLRYVGPIQGTKLNYAREDMELRGVRIPKGSPVMPLLGSANRDERVFDNADEFDVTRGEIKHLAFSQGNHFCLGAFLARMETRIAFDVLLNRTDEINLAVPASEVEPVAMPGWHRYASLPVTLRSCQ